MKKQGVKILGVTFLLVLAFGLCVSHSGEAVSQWREFRDTEELAQWLGRQPIIIISPGKFNKCDDVALGIQWQAYQDGYWVSVQLVENGKLLGTIVGDTSARAHMGNLVVIGNDIYYFQKLPWRGGYIIKQVAVRD